MLTAPRLIRNSPRNAAYDACTQVPTAKCSSTNKTLVCIAASHIAAAHACEQLHSKLADIGIINSKPRASENIAYIAWALPSFMPLR